MIRPLAFCLAMIAIGVNHADEPSSSFEIRFVDAESKRGIPLVELETVHNVRYVTDNAGRIAFHEPEHAGETMFFHVRPQGYHVEKDGLGQRGVKLKIEPGKSIEIPLRRINLAERLYRTTGQDLYRDSLLLGRPVPQDHLPRNGKVAGQDSVQTALYRDRRYWFWGDTNRLSYPLGAFRTTGAVTEKRILPEIGVPYRYFVGNDGFARNMAEVAIPDGVVWIDGLCTVRDSKGAEKMVTHYSRREGLEKQLEHGMMIYDDQQEAFEAYLSFLPDNSWQFLREHPVRLRDGEVDYLACGGPFPFTRVKATLDDVLDPLKYESWSCLPLDADPAKAQPRRTADGKLDWRWQAGPPVTQKEELRWLKSGAIKQEEARYVPEDVARPGRRVPLHSGTVFWNEFRKRWIMIAVELAQAESPSLLGEVWYSEAVSAQGPFKKAVRIVTHDKQSFYNPCHHPFFDEQGGRVIYFEGTYCNTFTNSPPTPRYNYNQIMYRLDLERTGMSAARE